jgi:hypothetical protein
MWAGIAQSINRLDDHGSISGKDTDLSPYNHAQTNSGALLKTHSIVEEDNEQ